MSHLRQPAPPLRRPRARHRPRLVDLTPVLADKREFRMEAPTKEVHKVPGATPSYPPEFKREAVRLVRSSPKKRSVSQIARELGVSDNSLRSWVKQTEIDQGEREGLTTE
jgi:transposase-like protein